MVKALKGKYHIPWIGLAYPKITWGSSNFIFRILCNRIQNCAALLVCSEPALSHATSLLRRLHWLVVARRITYKLCVLVFDVFHGTAPTYLTNHSSDSRLRSSSRGNFVVRRTRTRFADSRWTCRLDLASSLHPEHSFTLRAFCRQLNFTYLFTVPDWITLLMLIITKDF